MRRSDGLLSGPCRWQVGGHEKGARHCIKLDEVRNLGMAVLDVNGLHGLGIQRIWFPDETYRSAQSLDIHPILVCPLCVILPALTLLDIAYLDFASCRTVKVDSLYTCRQVLERVMRRPGWNPDDYCLLVETQDGSESRSIVFIICHCGGIRMPPN